MRAAGLTAAVAAIAVLATACGGGSGGGPGPHRTVYQKELAYAQCMRAHGDPGFPGPQSNGTFNTTKRNSGDFSGPRFLSASKAWGHLEGGSSAAVHFQHLSEQLKFAACMRTHG